MANPYHLPKGTPEGGEFTHGPDSAAAKDTEERHSWVSEVKIIKTTTVGRAAFNPQVVNDTAPIPGGQDLYAKLFDRALQANPGYNSGHYKQLKNWI